MVLIERANKTNDNTMPDKNMLAILYEEVSKDPREALKITAFHYQEQQLPLDEVLTRLLASAGAAPMNRTVRIHSTESKTITIATYSESDFRVNMFIADTSFPLARHVIGPQNTRTLTVLGWTDDTKILNATLYLDHVQKSTPEFMTALFNIRRLWLRAAMILPPRHIHDLDSTGVQDPDNFSTFRPKCTRYNPPGAPGSYVSRFTSNTSHMKLIICIRKDATPIGRLHGIHIVCYQQAISQ